MPSNLDAFKNYQRSTSMTVSLGKEEQSMLQVVRHRSNVSRTFVPFVGLLIVVSLMLTYESVAIRQLHGVISLSSRSLSENKEHHPIRTSSSNTKSNIPDHSSYSFSTQTPPTIDMPEESLLHEFRNYLIQDHNHDNDDRKTLFLQSLASLQNNHNGNSSNCPLDWMIFNSTNCIRNNKQKSICLFEGLVFKRIKDPKYKGFYAAETNAFDVLNEINFFPKLYYKNDQCLTMVMENVKPFTGTNKWTANYSYYENFFTKAFDVFNSNNVHPKDLNTCCNTVVNGEYIKIIDFDRYVFFGDTASIVAERNQEQLKEFLTWVKTETMKYKQK